jgi:hypothetical protein
MHFFEFHQTVARLERMRAKVQDKAGTKFEWSAIPSNGVTTKYALVGVKSQDEMQDDVLNAYIWAWNLKDMLKPHAIASGKSASWFENELSADKCLALCSDIANRAKHGALKKSRSGSFASLGELRYQIPQAAIASLGFGADWATTVVEKPELVAMELPVLDSHGRVIGDAFKVLECATRRWECLISELGLKLPATKPLGIIGNN